MSKSNLFRLADQVANPRKRIKLKIKIIMGNYEDDEIKDINDETEEDDSDDIGPEIQAFEEPDTL